MIFKKNRNLFGKRLFGQYGIFHNITLKIKYFIQRGLKGYCDKDLWEINTWFEKTVSRMMKEFSKNNIAYPKYSKNICVGYDDMSDEEKYRQWTKLTYHIGTLLEKSGGYKHEWELKKEQIHAKDRAFNLLRNNFYDLWW